MIQNYTMAPDKLVRVSGGMVRAGAPWNGPDALSGKPKKIQAYDTPEQIARCESCPYPDKCRNSDNCWWRLGLPRPKRGRPTKAKERPPHPPKGYDKEKLERAMVHNYLQKDIAKALGLSVAMARKWIAWRDR